VGGGGRKTSSLQKKKSAERAEERKKEKLNLCEPSWLAQGQEGTKNENPSVHHPSKMVHWWWVLVHAGPLAHLLPTTSP
jgi:hypothetical protein